MLTRRNFLIGSSALALLSSGCSGRWLKPAGPVIVNDLHGQLNPTQVARVVQVTTHGGLQEVIRRAGNEGQSISVAGGRHAMGGQQFGTGTVLIDTTSLNRVLSFDPARGLIEVEAGIQWPELVGYLIRVQGGLPRQWGIIQKQTGADRLCIGGALSANVHGRGLLLKPFVDDVESFVLVDAEGRSHRCSRNENAELFRLVIGGYGLFGVIASVTLRLSIRQKVQRVVEVMPVEELMPAFERRIAQGFLYGDFQYSTEMDSADFLRKGVFSCYRPVSADTPIPPGQKKLSVTDWKKLITLGHTDKRKAFRFYSDHYRATSGQIYWSDTHQMSTYIEDYHRRLNERLGVPHKATEVITEIYVPRDALGSFLNDVRADFRKHRVHVIYGTIRLVEEDRESFLAWAARPYACVIFNLHTVHTPEGLAKSARDFRRLIDLAILHGGSFFLTYHRWATRRQIEACYPQFPEFLEWKRKYDPRERFQSDWYRHYRKMFSDVL